MGVQKQEVVMEEAKITVLSICRLQMSTPLESVCSLVHSIHWMYLIYSNITLFINHVETRWENQLKVLMWGLHTASHLYLQTIKMFKTVNYSYFQWFTGKNRWWMRSMKKAHKRSCKDRIIVLFCLPFPAVFVCRNSDTIIFTTLNFSIIIFWLILTKDLELFWPPVSCFMYFGFLAGLYFVKLSKWEVRLVAEFVLKKGHHARGLRTV